MGVGRYALIDTPFPPIVGKWQITLQIRVSDFNEADVNFTDGSDEPTGPATCRSSSPCWWVRWCCWPAPAGAPT